MLGITSNEFNIKEFNEIINYYFIENKEFENKVLNLKLEPENDIYNVYFKFEDLTQTILNDVYFSIHKFKGYDISSGVNNRIIENLIIREKLIQILFRLKREQEESKITNNYFKDLYYKELSDKKLENFNIIYLDILENINYFVKINLTFETKNINYINSAKNRLLKPIEELKSFIKTTFIKKKDIFNLLSRYLDFNYSTFTLIYTEELKEEIKGIIAEYLEIKTEKPQQEKETKEFPNDIFKSFEAFECFKKYIDKIKDCKYYYLEVSYLFQKCLEEEFIQKLEHSEFYNKAKNIELIREIEKLECSDKLYFESLINSGSKVRIERFELIFKSILN